MGINSQVEQILLRLKKQGSEKNRAGMARYGINVDNAFGVSIPIMRKMAKEFGRDHKLALALWKTGNHEARLLACFVEDPKAVTEDQLESWVLDFDSWDICDQATTSLFDQTPFGWKKAKAWSTRKEEWVKRAGFALMAGLAVHDKKATDKDFKSLFFLIQKQAFDERNFVKKAINWALRNIGKRNLALNAAAIKCAEKTRDEANKKAGGSRGGDPDVRAARWIAADALRELQSEKVLKRLQEKS